MFRHPAIALCLFLIGNSCALADTRICNTGSVAVNLAYAYDTSIMSVHGWYALKPGECRSNSLGYWLAISQADRQGRRGIAGYYPSPWQVPIFYDSNREFCVHPTNGFNQSLAFGNVCSPGHEKVPFTIYARDSDGLFPATLSIKTDPDIPIRLFSAEAAASNEAKKYNERGNASYNSKNYDQAIAEFTKAIELSPQFEEAYNNRGVAKFSKRDYSGAVADYTKAIESFPGYVIAHHNRGFALIEQGDYQRASADCTRALELDPKDDYAYACRGRAYLKLGRLSEALADAHRSLQLRPSDATNLLDRAYILEALGRREEAIADASRALSVDPTLERAKETLRRLQGTGGLSLWYAVLTVAIVGIASYFLFRRQDAFRRMRQLFRAASEGVGAGGSARTPFRLLSGWSFRIPGPRLSAMGVWGAAGLSIGLVVLLLAGFVFLALAVASLEGMVRQLGFGPGATHMVFVLSLSLGLVALLWIAFGRFLAFARRRHLAAALIVAPVIALMSGAVAGLVIGYMVQLLGTPESSRASVHLIAFGAGVLLSIVHMVRKLRSAKESVRTETVVAARPT